MRQRCSCKKIQVQVLLGKKVYLKDKGFCLESKKLMENQVGSQEGEGIVS